MPGTPAMPPVDRTTLAPAGQGPTGLAVAADAEHHEADHDEHAAVDEHGHHYVHHTRDEMKIARSFFSIYFGMTALHGLHVLVGMGLMVWIGLRAWRGAFSPAYNLPVDLVGLYWHLVDLIWIFLFPLFYLI